MSVAPIPVGPIPVGPIPIGPVMIGKAVPFRGHEKSAIAKYPAGGPVAVGPLGLGGDEQADLVNHGGIDKAINHYPRDHYIAWHHELGGHPLLAAPGAFGENITTTGLLETDVCIGDRFRLGTALVEISQGRQPCWKIDHKFQMKGVTARVLQTCRSGWYYRVIEPGEVQAGDPLERVEQGPGGWTVDRVFRLMFHKGGDKGELADLATLPVLNEEWRARAAMLAG